MTDDQKPLSQPDGGSFHTVVVALLANLTIAVIKLIVMFSTRSSAMQAEAFPRRRRHRKPGAVAGRRPPGRAPA